MDDVKLFMTEIQAMMDKDYRSFLMALISIETGETERALLEHMYQIYMNTDDITLLHDFFHR